MAVAALVIVASVGRHVAADALNGQQIAAVSPQDAYHVVDL